MPPSLTTTMNGAVLFFFSLFSLLYWQLSTTRLCVQVTQQQWTRSNDEQPGTPGAGAQDASASRAWYVFIKFFFFYTILTVLLRLLVWPPLPLPPSPLSQHQQWLKEGSHDKNRLFGPNDQGLTLHHYMQQRSFITIISTYIYLL